MTCPTPPRLRRGAAQPLSLNIESEARRLRAAIYGDVTDLAWSMLIPTWTRPDNLHWLRQNQPLRYAPCPPRMHWKTWNGHPDAPA